MKKDGLLSENKPLWLLAELTYRCPLQCPYCSNPLDFAGVKSELTTAEWKRVFDEGRELGAVQLGFSGGEPLLRPDLEELVAHASKVGYYTNLITSGLGMDEARVASLKEAGLDHIQISFQAEDGELNNAIAGNKKAFDQKIAMAKAVKKHGYPMVLNIVIHKHNIDRLPAFLDLANELNADHVELANSQYYGWALLNRDHLLPSRESLDRALAVTEEYRKKFPEMDLFFIIPDYYADRPKPCMGGWAKVFLTIIPDGTALPCHSARILPMDFPNVRERGLKHIWQESEAFNRYRGDSWMKEPCRSCSEKDKDFGGCRCQAFLFTRDAANADPVCSKSPFRPKVDEAIRSAALAPPEFSNLTRRSAKNSKTYLR